MRVRVALAVMAGLLMAGSAVAAPKFAAYEGSDAIVQGQGGTRITKDGVDFWTSGAPPHRYQILGVLTDQRGSGLFSGDVVGSSGVVARVKELGGSAVIVGATDASVTGAMVISGNVALARSRTTQLLVVKYLDEAPTAAPPSPAPSQTLGR